MLMVKACMHGVFFLFHITYLTQHLLKCFRATALYFVAPSGDLSSDVCSHD